MRALAAKTIVSGTAAAILLLIAAAALMVQQRTISQLREQNHLLRIQVEEVEILRAELAEAERAREQLRTERPGRDNIELLRLRREVQDLREAANEAALLRLANARLLQAVYESGTLTSNQIAYITSARKEGAVLGIHIVRPTDPGAPVAASQYKGALIGGFMADAPVATSGLQVGDVIIALDGRPIDSETALQAELLTKKPGEVVLLDVLRSGEVKRFQVRTRTWPGVAGQ
jgi:C-terminal processing protease CtpA/Prc